MALEWGQKPISMIQVQREDTDIKLLSGIWLITDFSIKIKPVFNFLLKFFIGQLTL